MNRRNRELYRAYWRRSEEIGSIGPIAVKNVAPLISAASAGCGQENGPYKLLASGKSLEPAMTRARLVLFLSSALMLASTQARALPLDDESGFPQFDIVNSCRNAASQTTCIASEKDAADLLRDRWPSLAPDDRKRCIAVGRSTDGGSYLATLGCLSKQINRRS
jgi:hypothetical protein